MKLTLLAMIASFSLTASVAVAVGNSEVPESALLLSFVPKDDLTTTSTVADSKFAPAVPPSTVTTAVVEISTTSTTVIDLVLNLPSVSGLPVVPETSIPVPTVPDAPDTPVITIPTIPTLPSITIPTLPTITLPSLPVGPPEVPENPIDSEFLDQTNAERSIDLIWSNELAAYAKVHLRRMMRVGELSHSEIGRLLTHWRVVGENVGKGPTVTAIHSAYMNSPTHADNVTLPNYTHFGSASETDAAGFIWTAEVFAAK